MGIVAVDGLYDDHFMFIGGVFGKPAEFFQPFHLPGESSKGTALAFVPCGIRLHIMLEFFSQV